MLHNLQLTKLFCFVLDVWKAAVPEKPRLVFEVDAAINQLQWSKDGSFLVICSEDGKVRIWKTPRG